MVLKEQVERLLADLGQTVDEVTQNIEACGLRGVRNTIRTLNPLVRYLQVKINDEAVEFDLRAMIRDNTLRIKQATTEERDTVVIPEPVLQFLANFNRGAYPHLEFDDKTPLPTTHTKLSGSD